MIVTPDSSLRLSELLTSPIAPDGRPRGELNGQLSLSSADVAGFQMTAMSIRRHEANGLQLRIRTLGGGRLPYLPHSIAELCRQFYSPGLNQRPNVSKRPQKSGGYAE